MEKRLMIGFMGFRMLGMKLSIKKRIIKKKK
jgi:hypothetical protein